jgi:hypothetical protein
MDNFIFDTYIDNIFENINDHKDTVMRNYYKENGMSYDFQEGKDENDEIKKIETVPFAMKVFKRRVEKYTSYHKNLKHIRNLNSIVHRESITKKKEDKEEEK